MQKINIEQMKQRNLEARESIEKAYECLKVDPIDKAKAADFIEKAQKVVGLQQLELDELKPSTSGLDENQLNAARVLLAEYTILCFRLEKLRMMIR